MKRHVLITILLILAAQASAEAQLSCTAEESCSGTGLVYMSDTSNAHASLITETPYSYTLCCTGIEGLVYGNSAEHDQVLFRLSHPENAHVGSNYSSYTNPVSISVDNPTITSVSCFFSSTGCQSGQDCVASLSGRVNAHIGECGIYSHEICCEFVIDTTPPTISDTYAHDGSWAGGQQTITLEPLDQDSGIGSVRYCWDQGLTCDPSSGIILASPYEITVSETTNDVLRYQAWDNAELSSSVGSVSVMVDVDPPVTVCPNCPSSSDIKGAPFSVSLSSSDAGSGVSSTEYCVYKEPETTCSSFLSYTGPVTIGSECVGDGEVCTYGIRFRSTDATGNQEAVKEASGMTIDRNRPWCEFTTSLPEHSDTRTINLAWDADDPVTSSTFQSYEIMAERSPDGGFTWDLADSATINQESQKTHSFSLTQDGHYRFSCVATYDRPPLVSSAAGEELTEVDTTPPSVDITSPERTQDTEFTISWTASDSGSGLDRFSLSVDGSTVDDQISGTQFSYTYSGSPGQTYSVSLTGYDQAGNPSSPATSSITVDNEPPGCFILQLPEFKNQTTFTLEWNSPDSDVDFYDVCINTDGSACTGPSSGWNQISLTSREFTGSHGAMYYFSCRATDTAGNQGGWSSQESTTIDNRAPEIENNQPEYSSQVVAGDTFEDLSVNLTVEDDVGIQDVSLSVGSETVEPESSSGSPGDAQWSLTYSIPYSTYSGHSGFSVSLLDVNLNSDSMDFNYSVLSCSPGQERECHPRDRERDEIYSQGACGYSATMICNSQGEWGECLGGILPAAEDCNNVDDDCDGQTDEDLRRQECGFGNIGICRYGYRDCINGFWQDCVGAKLPEPAEICDNGWDDDCDGATDEGCVCAGGDSQPCGESNVGICRTGTQFCEAGSWGECQGSVLPEMEICDELDNDCDGEVDEGCYGGGYERDTELPDFPWWILSVVGVAILLVLAFLWLKSRQHGEELNWENLRKRYTPGHRNR